MEVEKLKQELFQKQKILDEQVTQNSCSEQEMLKLMEKVQNLELELKTNELN